MKTISLMYETVEELKKAFNKLFVWKKLDLWHTGRYLYWFRYGEHPVYEFGNLKAFSSEEEALSFFEDIGENHYELISQEPIYAKIYYPAITSLSVRKIRRKLKNK